MSTLVSERVGWDVRGLQSRLMQFQAMSIMAEIEGETEVNEAEEKLLVAIKAYPNGSFDIRPSFTVDGETHRFQTSSGAVYEYTIHNGSLPNPSLSLSLPPPPPAKKTLRRERHRPALLVETSRSCRSAPIWSWRDSVRFSDLAGWARGGAAWAERVSVQEPSKAMLVKQKKAIDTATDRAARLRSALLGGSSFVPPPGPSPFAVRVTVLLEIVAARGFDYDSLYVEYAVKTNSSAWSVTSGQSQLTGCTQVTTSTYYEPDATATAQQDSPCGLNTRVTHFGFPVELELEAQLSPEPSEWPTVYFQVGPHPHTADTTSPAGMVCSCLPASHPTQMERAGVVARTALRLTRRLMRAIVAGVAGGVVRPVGPVPNAGVLLSRPGSVARGVAHALPARMEAHRHSDGPHAHVLHWRCAGAGGPQPRQEARGTPGPFQTPRPAA